MLDKRSLWATATRVHQALAAQSIPHALVGGVAVCLHGYQRNTVDVDVLVASGMSESTRNCMESAGFVWDPTLKEFRSETDPPVQFLIAGERAGSRSEVLLPDPKEPDVVAIEGLPVVSLAK